MDTTGGLVSAYQLMESSAQRIASHSVSNTSAEQISVELVSLPQLAELRENEFVKIKVAPEHDQLAFAILVKRTQLGVLPGRLLAIARGGLRILEEAGIPYEVVE